MPEEKAHVTRSALFGGHSSGSHEEHEGAPEWLISFADNVTLMMGFFVLMLALTMKMSGGGPSDQTGPGKPSTATLDTIISIREGFNNPIDLNSTHPKDQALIRRILQKRRESEAKDDGPPGRQHEVQSLRPSDASGLCGAVSFEDGSSQIPDHSEQSIQDIARYMIGLRMFIEIRGHVSVAEAAELDDRGMKLSYDRAFAVGRALTGHGIIWSQLRLIASAANDRVEPLSYEPEAHQLNQRVEVIATGELLPEYDTP